MLKAELKRILKTRSTWWLTAIALAICLVAAFITINQVVKYIQHEDGQTETIRGVSVYKENKERYSCIKGEVNPELFATAVTAHHDLLAQFGTDYDIPPEISQAMGAYSPVYTWIYRWFSNEYGVALTSADISPEQARNFNQERLHTLELTLSKKYGQKPQVIEYVMSKAHDERGVFNYSYGIGSTNTYTNLGLCAFLVTLICIIITAPIFSSDYASGADEILRCTRRGRRRLAVTKICSSLIIDLGVFLLCFGAFLVVVYFAFGFDDITSAELLQVEFNPHNLTAMGILGAIILSSFLTLLATSCFTLFLSSQLKSSLGVLSLSMTVALLPTIIRIFWAGGSFGRGFAVAEGNILNWIRVCLPSGGVSMMGAMTDELVGLRFLWLGDFVIWSPYVLLAAAVLQIPIWFTLAIRTYDRHQAAR